MALCTLEKPPLPPLSTVIVFAMLLLSALDVQERRKSTIIKWRLKRRERILGENLKGCLDNNEPFKATSCYYEMVSANSRPNKFTYPTLLKACGIAEATKEGVQVHAHVIKQGLSGDGHIRSSGIQMYATFGHMCGDVDSAKELFEKMEDRSIGSWNAMVSGLAKCGMVKEARELFDDMSEKDEISWSAMIDGYIKGGYYKEALEVFNVMQIEEIRPRKFVLSSVLAACANVGALDQGRWIHAYVKKNPDFLDAVLGTALVDMYMKCGRLDMAWDVFETLKEKEVFTWNAMICGLAMHGLVDEGLRNMESMEKVYDIEPEMEHYGCVVDLLGRAGLLAEAEELIFSMPMEPNAAVWGALLGACRIHGNAELGERVGRFCSSWSTKIVVDMHYYQTSMRRPGDGMMLQSEETDEGEEESGPFLELAMI
ncbi:hypothetical protein GH714_026245 [Hevea brasiliensis]|uniref:Pentacotripeptide-repeat region of PRORP domain-containing protein n=1 Tax=Hevea brasiliensis TaxID=3981 RepID=A0A6A6M0V0_HEVBR|nr:hypothetical protein GH714_026245 [Hevea brasiliensis]